MTAMRRRLSPEVVDHDVHLSRRRGQALRRDAGIIRPVRRRHRRPGRASAWSRSWIAARAPTTRPAPRRLATCTAIPPAFPVAPRTSTDWPGSKGTRRRRATQADIAGFMAAAILLLSTPPATRSFGGRRPRPARPWSPGRRRERRSTPVGHRGDGRPRRRPGSSATSRCCCSADPRRPCGPGGAARRPGRRPAPRPALPARACRTAHSEAGGRMIGRRRRACSCCLRPRLLGGAST